MALTPEDVVNKRFQPTKFREGYDQDEVDDFLDEVVVELRRLGQENEELRQRLVSGDARISELQRSGGSAPAVSQPLGAESPVAAEVAAPVSAAVAAPVAEVAVAPAAVFPGGDQANDPNNTNNLLQLARRLHEEHVREGIEKRDALIAEGHATAARIVSEAEAQQRAELDTLEQERQSLEGRVEDLRSFEREYRAKLKGHIETILHDLDSTGDPVSVSAHSMPVPSDAVQEHAVHEDAVHEDAMHEDAVPADAVQQDAESPDAAEQEPANFGAVPAQPQSGFPGFGGN